MKKFTLFLVALFAMVNVATAQRAWAYDLGLTSESESYTFAFKAVTAANATLVFYQDGVEAGTLNLGSVPAGANIVTKTSAELLSAIQKSGDFTWGVTMTGSAIALAGNYLTELTAAGQGLDFYLPQGVVVDNNPESSTFGTLFIAEAQGGKLSVGPTHTRGIFYYDPTLTELNTPETGAIPSNVTLSNTTRQAMHRIAINPINNHVAFAYNVSGSPAVWSVPANNPTGTATNLIAGTEITMPNSICFDENGVLYVMDDANTTNGGTLYRVVDGTATKITQNKIWAHVDNSLAYDGRGGIWIAQSVDNNNWPSYEILSHINKNGEIDWKSSDYKSTSLFSNANSDGYSKRGQVAYSMKDHLLVFGGNERTHIFQVTYDATTGVPSLGTTYKYRTPWISDYGNIDGLAFDYAGDLYVMSAKRERLYKYVVPTTNNTCTTPAKKSQVITLVSATPEYNVTINTNGEGTVSGANSGVYTQGAELNLTATPAEHYTFTGWTGDVESTDNPLTVTVNSGMTITANFAKKNYTLTVFVNDENRGTIDVATGSHEAGAEVTLTATPKAGYKLLAWSNKATTPSITLTMDNNKAVSAYFVKEYATDPTFTIEKVWENTNVPAATANGFQGVGWDQTIYIKDRGNNQILSLDATESSTYATLETSSDDQPIAVDEAGNLIVRSGSTLFYNAPTQVRIFRKGETTSKEINFVLPATGRCDFITASGDIFSEKGGYVYFFCLGQKTVSRLFIKNGEYVGVDAVGTVGTAAASQSNVVLDIYGNIHTQSKNAGAFEYNITTLTSTADPYLGAVNKQTPNSTIGGCTFELGGKEFWAYVAGTTNFSSEWQLINATDGKLVSEEILFAKDKTSKNSVANWLNVQVVDEKTAYIYQFCPTVVAALWKVTMKETFTVGASANTAEWGTVAGAGKYLEGTTATLTATPNTGYKFVNWAKGGTEVSTDATYTFTVTEDVELVANFEALAQYTINAHAELTNKGYVTGGGTYYEGTTVELKATAKSGYYFTQWNDGNTDNPRTITVNAAVEYIAQFAEAHPRAWAYDLKLGEEGENYTFAFNATTAGQATIIFKDKDGNALAQPASQTIAAVAGENNKFTIAKNEFVSGTDAFWSITMDGDPVEGIAEVTDQTRGIYDFYNMMGVVVDNNTDSKDFGKIYVQASLNGKTDGITNRADEQKAGIFIYNQNLDELNDPSNVGYKPTLPSGYAEIGSSYSSFQRLNIHPKTGNLVFSHAVSGKPAVFAINRDDMTGVVTNLLTGVADMTRSVAHCFDAEGTLFVMDFADSQGAVYKVVNGDATRITEISSKFINAQITMASDGRGGLWISQNRGQMDDAPYYYQLVHVNSAGKFDWAVNKETPHGFEGSSSRGALAYDAERNILAQGRNGKVELYTVTYEPTITLTPLYTIASDDLSNNIDGLAFDIAGDLYVVNSGKEKFQKFTLPTDENICTVAAPSSEAIRFTPVYTVSVESNNNEWGIVSGGGTFEEGQSTTITATAATNYKFVNWTKGGAAVSTDNPYTFSVTETATYTANFVEKTKCTIDVTILDDEKMGTVTGVGSYYEGTEVTLTAKANGGYVFVKWGDEVTDESRTVTASEDVTLQAIFKVATPRAWAYDLRLDSVADPANYTFTFKTTSAGSATLIFKDEDGNIQNFGTHTATATEAGEQTITIAKTVFVAATKDIYWEVELAGEAIAKMAEITDPTRNIYDFYNMMGVVVDNDPNSDEFGKIYIQQSYNGASDGIADRSDTQTAGIFIYNQALEELNAPANTGIKPQLPYTIGASRQVFKRITINPSNGDIAFCNNTTTSGGAYAVSRENLAGEAINLTKHISEIQKVNALCFDDEGNLYVVANVSTSGSPNGNIYQIKTDGTYTELTTNGVNLFYDQEIAMASDGHGGLWIAQNRWGTAAGTLFHVNVAENKIDFKVEAGKDYSDWFEGANYRGAIAYDKQRDILAVHSQACASVFQVTYAADGVPSISKICQTPNLGMNELDGLAFDYAGDLYVVHSGTERFYKYVLPTTDNTCIVPAPESQFIQKETRYTVTVAVNDEAMGTATVGGTEFLYGDQVTVTAVANPNYEFLNWTENETVVSTDAEYTFNIKESRNLVANFQLEPLKIKGIVKRAVQVGESTVVLTHEGDGTPHLYKVVDDVLDAEISQEGVVVAAAGYLSISDIAATEDGKLVACNSVNCSYTPSGTNYFYIWNNLASNPEEWFTSQSSANYTNATVGGTMAVKGASTNAEVIVLAVTTGATQAARYVRHTVNGSITTKYSKTGTDTYTEKLYAPVIGTTYELNASPLADMSWVVDGELVAPIEFTTEDATNTFVTIDASLEENLLGKKFNGATYFSIAGAHFMIAPYADAEGKVAGVKLMHITDGLAAAKVLKVLDLPNPETATAAATAVLVDEVDNANGQVSNDVTITLITDEKVHILTTELDIYVRDIDSGTYGTVCLPNNAIDYCGASLYEVAGKDNGMLYFDEIATMEAGKPYLLLAEKSKLIVVYGTASVAAPINNGVMKGTFEDIVDGTILKGNYMVYNNTLRLCGDGCWLNAYRAYFGKSELDALGKPMAPMPGRRRISMGGAGDNQTTALENITEGSGVLTPIIEGTYDVLGRELSEPNATGFYIINGKKVVTIK